MSGKMFDNKDYPTEWALNPSSYRNMDNDQVDWAALAQQWIKMKETNVPSAPTPPSISENPTNSSFGAGEAPMDMEFKDDEIPPAPPAPNISGADNWNRWNQWESNWNQGSVGLGSANWDWNNVSPEPNETLTRIPNNLMIPPPAPVISSTPTFVEHGAVGSTVPLESSSLSSSFGYNTMTLPRSHFNNQVSNSGFWNNEHPHASGTTSSSFLKDIRPGIARIPSSSATLGTLPTLEITSRNRDVKEKTPENDSLNTLDTLKRKQLPAWIREGLEKMEREKQKAIERERQAVLHKQELEACKKIKDQARAVLSPDKSKFDSDSEKELPEHEFPDLKENNQDDLDKLQKTNCDQGSPDVTRPRKTRFRDASSPEKLSNVVKLPNTDVNTNNTTASIGPCPRLNKEELLQNLMLKVRRSLTEILLEVTNDEIISTCEEVWKNVHTKGNILTTSSGHTAPLAQITRRLGLGIYSDSDSESSDEHLVQNQSEKSMTSKNDSDEELKETLRLRQQAFKKTEAEIEASLAEEEENTKGEEQLAKNKKASSLVDRQDRITSNDKNTKDKNKHKTAHAVQESNKNWKENCNRDNDHLPVGNRKSSLYNDDEKPTSDIITSQSIARRTPDRFNQEEGSSSSESGNQSGLSKRKASYGSNNGKNNIGSSLRKKNARSSEHTKRYSSSRSRSRSKNDSSSRENSCESSSSKLYANSISTDKTVKKHESKSETHKNNRELNKKSANHKNAQYGRPRSRSTSQSDAHFRSESRSRSRSRSKSRSRARSNSTVRSKQKRSRSRSYSSFRRQHRSRNNLHSRSRHRSRSQSQSRSRSTSRSRSKSRSRKRSKSSYSSKSTATGTKSEGVRRRNTRSRSTERTRRSRSNTRKSKNSHRQHHRYERDRASKKSNRHHVD